VIKLLPAVLSLAASSFSSFFFSQRENATTFFDCVVVCGSSRRWERRRRKQQSKTLSRFVCILQCSFYTDAPVYLYIIQESESEWKRERGSNEGKPPGQWHRDREPTSGSSDGKSQQTFSLLQGAQTARRRRRRRRRSVIPPLLIFHPLISIEAAAPPPLPCTHTQKDEMKMETFTVSFEGVFKKREWQIKYTEENGSQRTCKRFSSLILPVRHQRTFTLHSKEKRDGCLQSEIDGSRQTKHGRCNALNQQQNHKSKGRAVNEIQFNWSSVRHSGIAAEQEQERSRSLLSSRQLKEGRPCLHHHQL